jgi:hypothetical protein
MILSNTMSRPSSDQAGPRLTAASAHQAPGTTRHP